MNETGDQTIRRGLKRLAAEVFPGVATGIAFADGFDVLPEEMSALGNAVPARQNEFSAGRTAARGALARALPIPQGADRAPVWPAGVVGSISHADDWAIAAVSSAHRWVGVDLEPDEDLPDEVWDTILLPAEREWLHRQMDPARWAKVIFCAKECAYKAQYPITRTLFGFEMFAVRLGTGAFSAEFQRDVGLFHRGDRLEGRFARGAGFILTGIAG